MDEIIGELKGKVKRIGIMGGTFDPIHYGHLIAAETVREKLSLDRIIFVPSGNPPHKKDMPITLSEHRYAMVQLAAISNPYFTVSRIELDRKGFAYTVDTIKEAKSILGEDIKIFFIAGADAILEILTWKNVGELLSSCSFIAVTRPGYKKQELEDMIKNLKVMFKCEILQMEVPAFDISSTAIRHRVFNKESIKYMVPEEVETYIMKNNLYI